MKKKESTVADGMLMRVTDQSNALPLQVTDLISQIERDVSGGSAIPFVAFVSGSGINRQIEFVNYDADQHKPVVAEVLMTLVRDGVERIVVVSEVWFLREGSTPEWHGVMICESTAMADICHVAPFEGSNRLGAWDSGPAGGTGNLANLFERAWLEPEAVRLIPSTNVGDSLL